MEHSIREEMFYESFRAVNNGWRFTARIKLVSEKIAKVDHRNEEIDTIYEKKSLRSNFPG